MRIALSISLLKNEYKRAVVTLFVAIYAVGVPYLAQSSETMSAQDIENPDPIFSTGYDPQRVHFESLETKTLLPSCEKMLSDMNPLPRELTLYAKYTHDSTHIYVVGKAEVGAILVIRNGVCDVGIPLLSITQTHHNPPLHSDAPDLTDTEVTGLFKDTLARHTKAFGGKEAFIEWLDKTAENARGGCKGLPDVWCPPTYHTFQPLLQQMLQDFRK